MPQVPQLASRPEVVCWKAEHKAAFPSPPRRGDLPLLPRRFSAPDVLKTARIPLVLVQGGLPTFFSFGGSNADAVRAQLKGAEDGASRFVSLLRSKSPAPVSMFGTARTPASVYRGQRRTFNECTDITFTNTRQQQYCAPACRFSPHHYIPASSTSTSVASFL
jgi:hypothetical protein